MTAKNGLAAIVILLFVGSFASMGSQNRDQYGAQNRDQTPNSLPGEPAWTTANVNVRTGRGTDHGVATTLPEGLRVSVDRLESGWYAVSKGGRQIGYASSDYFRTLPPPAASRAASRTSVRKPKGEHPIYGDSGILRASGGGTVPVAATRAVYDRLVQLATSGDDVGLNQLMLGGNVWLVKSGTSVHVIDTDWTRFEVRVLDGPRAGRSGFTKRDFVWKS